MQQLTFESSRDFHIACVDDDELTRIADVPGVDVQRFRTALADDADARSRLGGGSIGEDRSLLLVASVEDADVAKRVVAASGGELDMAGVRYGTSEFVP